VARSAIFMRTISGLFGAIWVFTTKGPGFSPGGSTVFGGCVIRLSEPSGVLDGRERIQTAKPVTVVIRTAFRGIKGLTKGPKLYILDIDAKHICLIGVLDMRYPILALLAEKPAHGYELKQIFDNRFGAVWPPINAGQIYNTLSALERDDLVQSKEVPQRGSPSKRVYELTEKGRVTLEEWLKETSDSPTLKEEFIIKLVLAYIAGAADPVTIIDRQRQEYFKAIRELNDLAANQDNDITTKLLIGAASLYIQALLKWLDQCEEEFTDHPSKGSTST
jgi:DNA-binding PadR family transcriptional regulator